MSEPQNLVRERACFAQAPVRVEAEHAGDVHLFPKNLQIADEVELPPVGVLSVISIEAVRGMGVVACAMLSELVDAAVGCGPFELGVLGFHAALCGQSFYCALD